VNGEHVDIARALGISLARATEESVRQEARRALAGSQLTDAQKQSAARLYRAALLSRTTPRKRV
jgi:hypothetical protein